MKIDRKTYNQLSDYMLPSSLAKKAVDYFLSLHRLNPIKCKEMIKKTELLVSAYAYKDQRFTFKDVDKEGEYERCIYFLNQAEPENKDVSVAFYSPEHNTNRIFFDFMDHRTDFHYSISFVADIVGEP